MKVYIVITEKNEDVNFDDDQTCLIRSIHGVYLLESFAEAALIEVKEHCDYAYVEEHFVE